MLRKIKPKTESYMVNASKKGESEPIYPRFSLDLDHIPEAKDWKIGETYNIEFKVKMTGLSQSRFDNSADFEILEIETESDEDEKKEDEEDDKEEE